MTAKEFLEHDNSIWNRIDSNNLTKVAMIEFAQAYHESEVKNQHLQNVSNQRELLLAFAKWYNTGSISWDSEITYEQINNFLSQQ